MEDKDYEIIQNRIGYEFKNLDLLQQAFVRRSYAQEEGGQDNEILEFIGDKVLDMSIVRMLAEEFGSFCSSKEGFDDENDYDEFCCEHSEGELTEIKSSLVEKKTLAKVIDEMDLAQFLIVGKGDYKNRVYQQESVKEDLFEAIVGAIALDCGWDWDKIISSVDYMLQPKERIESCENENYVELIQQWSLRKHGILPEIVTANAGYREVYPKTVPKDEIRAKPEKEVKRSGRLNDNEFRKNHFLCRLKLKGVKHVFIGTGKSRKEARKVACSEAYHYLDVNHLLTSIEDEVGRPSRADSINQLETLSRRGYFPLPEYSYSEGRTKDGNSSWSCVCSIEGFKRSFRSRSSSKKEAKKSAAYKMIKYVLQEYS